MLRKTAETIASEVTQLPQATTPNYKMSMAASAALGTLWLISNLEGCGLVASKVALGFSLLSLGAAINQYGIQNAQSLAIKTYNGFFGSKKKEAERIIPAASIPEEISANVIPAATTPEEMSVEEENTELSKKTM